MSAFTCLQSEEDQIPDAGRDELKTQIAVHANKMLSQAEKSVIPLKKLLILCRNRDLQVPSPVLDRIELGI